MSLEPLVCEHLRIDPLAIVAHAQSELLVVIANLHLDSVGVRVPERIPKGFRRNLVDLVTNDGAEIARFTLDLHTEGGALVGRRVGRELVAQGSDRDSEIVAFDGRRPQALHRVAALGDRLRRMFNRDIQFVFRVCRAFREQVRCGLESQQQTMKALEQRVVELPRNTCALADARLERERERVLHLTHPELVRRPQQCRKQTDAQGTKPVRLVVRRGDGESERVPLVVPHPTVIARGHAKPVVAGRKV